jgi:hypothetical protein
LQSIESEDAKGRTIPARLRNIIEQLAHRAYPALPEEHLRREREQHSLTGRKCGHKHSFAAREREDIESLRQALELHAVLIAISSLRINNGASQENRSPPPGGRMQGDQDAGTVGSQIIFWLNVLMEGR